jgi:hypothetical protein
MVISLYSIFGTGLVIQPDPAIVHVGDRVEWQFLYLQREGPPSSEQSDPFRFGPLKWMVYFRGEQPFGRNHDRELSSPVERGQRASITFGTAKDSGDYKYGVRLIAGDGEEISDDDPLLIVRP